MYRMRNAYMVSFTSHTSIRCLLILYISFLSANIFSKAFDLIYTMKGEPHFCDMSSHVVTCVMSSCDAWCGAVVGEGPLELDPLADGHQHVAF